MLVLLAVLSMDSASSAKCSCSSPTGDAGPVIGPSKPMLVLHLLLPPAAPVLPPPLLPQPAMTSAPSAPAAMIPVLFMRYALPCRDDLALRGEQQPDACRAGIRPVYNTSGPDARREHRERPHTASLASNFYAESNHRALRECKGVILRFDLHM